MHVHPQVVLFGNIVWSDLFYSTAWNSPSEIWMVTQEDVNVALNIKSPLWTMLFYALHAGMVSYVQIICFHPRLMLFPSSSVLIGFSGCHSPVTPSFPQAPSVRVNYNLLSLGTWTTLRQRLIGLSIFSPKDQAVCVEQRGEGGSHLPTFRLRFLFFLFFYSLLSFLHFCSWRGREGVKWLESKVQTGWRGYKWMIVYE